MKNDLSADLAADLRVEATRPAPLPSAPPTTPLPEVPMAAGSPCVSVRFTPLRWSRPCLDSAEQGAGMAVKLGPWRIELCL